MAATATRSPTRPTRSRSNSLQRMLELEQECMRERRAHVDHRQLCSESHNAHGAALPSHTPTTPLHLQLPPIDTGVTNFNPAQMFGFVPSPVISGRNQHETIVSTSESRKHVAFSAAEDTMVDDRKDMCQSPSWEAYGRRKKEKKERELADKETDRAQRRKLTKVPPSPSPSPPLAEKSKQGQTSTCRSPTDPIPRPRPHQQAASGGRPNSVVGLCTPNVPATLDAEKPRGRSSSFSSLFRTPFEVRRASVDADTGDGFIGGIKLEQRRLAAQQKALEDQAAEARKAVQRNRNRSESPLRFLVPRSEPREKRTYPPIAIQTTRNQAVLSQDDGMMRKWKARVGLRSRSREPLPDCGQKLTKPPTAQRPNISAPTMISSSTPDVASKPIHIPASKSTPNVNSPTVVQKIHGPVEDEKMYMLSVDPASHPVFDDGGAGSGSEYSYMTDPESPPPPPRRSSKRKSTVNAGDLEKPVALTPSRTLPTATTKQPVGVEVRPNRWTMSDPPSIPYDSVAPIADKVSANQQQRRTFKEAARAAFNAYGALSPPVMPAVAADRSASQSRSPTTRTLRNSDERVLPADKYRGTLGRNSHKPAIQDWGTSCAIAPPSPPYNSSEGSVSDGFRSLGEYGTPDSSRPQSERGMFPTFGDDRKKGRRPTALPSPALSGDEGHYNSNQPSPLELDPIQAAALKVMTAFPDSNACRSQKPRRGGGEQQPARINTAIEGDQDPESKSPPLRELIMARDETSVVVPWPATYLQAARKAAPAAQAPKKPPPTVAPQRLPTPQEPIAKVFVECCECKYFHDMPSKLYEAMAHPEGVVALGDDVRFAGTVSMTVKCPWCKHEMSTRCCAGLAAMVYVKERLH